MHGTYPVACHGAAVHGPGPRVDWSGQLLNLSALSADTPDERRMSSIVGEGGTYLAGSSESLIEFARWSSLVGRPVPHLASPLCTPWTHLTGSRAASGVSHSGSRARQAAFPLYSGGTRQEDRREARSSWHNSIINSIINSITHPNKKRRLTVLRTQPCAPSSPRAGTRASSTAPPRTARTCCSPPPTRTPPPRTQPAPRTRP